ncbi:Transcription factor HBP-1b(c1) [Vitis vinifera]|uniref:Transcription factor HBP-1b(C1) n=1 Tax=Vitis vinifera TaxID=29760 RepID=A0A438I8E9_VITVI|nr:Transcription factor HBP-1b(c1) [Vitis vinifera]
MEKLEAMVGLCLVSCWFRNVEGGYIWIFSEVHGLVDAREKEVLGGSRSQKGLPGGEKGPLADGVARRNEEKEEYWRLVEMEINCDCGRKLGEGGKIGRCTEGVVLVVGRVGNWNLRFTRSFHDWELKVNFCLHNVNEAEMSAGEKILSIDQLMSSRRVLPNCTDFSCTEGNSIHSYRVSDFGTLEQSIGFHLEDAVDLSGSTAFNSTKPSGRAVTSDPLHSVTFDKSQNSFDINPSAARVESQRLPLQKGQQSNLVSISSGSVENWGESAMADASPRTDISTDVDTDDKVQRFERGQPASNMASDSSDRSKDKNDQKTLRRLAQNREAARKSRLRKKVCILLFNCILSC